MLWSFTEILFTHTNFSLNWMTAVDYLDEELRELLYMEEAGCVIPSLRIPVWGITLPFTKFRNQILG
jgi:hypothetical protein